MLDRSCSYGSSVSNDNIITGSKGIEVGAPVPASKAIELPSYAFARKIIGKEFFEF